MNVLLATILLLGTLGAFFIPLTADSTAAVAQVARVNETPDNHDATEHS